MDKPAIHTVYFGPKNMHGTRVIGTVLAYKGPDSAHREARFLFRDEHGNQHWVRESSIEFIPREENK